MKNFLNRRSDIIMIAVGLIIAIIGFLIKRQIYAMENADDKSMSHIEVLTTLTNEHEVRIVLLENQQNTIIDNQKVIIEGLNKIDKKL